MMIELDTADIPEEQTKNGLTAPLTQGLVGVYGTSDDVSQDTSTALNAMTRGLNTQLTTTAAANSQAGIASTETPTTIRDDILLAAVGRPRLNECLISNDQLAAEYDRFGLDFFQKLSGEFALAIVDTNKKLAAIVTDRLARFPLYYYRNNGSLIFGSSASSVLAHPDLSSQVQHQGLYNYLYNHMVPSPSTVYSDLHKLPAAHCLVFHNQEIELKRYWSPSFTHSTPKSNTDLGAELRSTLKRSVSNAIEGEERVGAFLSGGLDSSSVVGMLAELSEGQAEAFSIGFSAKGYDEMEYARIAAKHFGVKLNEYYVTPDDVVNALPLIATSYDEPFGNSSALPAWFCANFAAQNGINTLLAGDGGDELFAGNERYAKQKLFQHYYKLPKLLREGVVSPLSRALPAQPTPFRKIKSYIEQASIPLPDRLQSYNFLERHSLSELFTADFLAAIQSDQPLRFMQETYASPQDADDVNRMLYLDWQYTLADNDLRKVSHMCAIANVDVRYPMLDDQLIEFSCRVPSNTKLRGQQLRDFYKSSLRGWLPDATIDKPKQGFGLPFGVWLKEYTPLRELGYDSLTEFKKRNIIRADFIDELMKLHQNTHAHYYGEFIWVLVVLELWLEKHT